MTSTIKTGRLYCVYTAYASFTRLDACQARRLARTLTAAGKTVLVIGL